MTEMGTSAGNTGIDPWKHISTMEYKKYVSFNAEAFGKFG